MKISVKKLDSNIVEQWSAEIEATNHASISYMLLDPDGTTLHLAGIAPGIVDGNSLIGEQDGFIAKLNSITGEVQ